MDINYVGLMLAGAAGQHGSGSAEIEMTMYSMVAYSVGFIASSPGNIS